MQLRQPVLLTAMALVPSLAMAQTVTEIATPTVPIALADFNLLTPGPTTVGAINAIAAGSSISNITLTPNTTAAGVYDTNATANALGLVGGGLEILDFSGTAAFDAFDAQIDFNGPCTEVGFGIGDWVGAANISFYLGGTLQTTFTSTTYTTNAVKYFQMTGGSFDRIDISVNTGGNWVIVNIASQILSGTFAGFTATPNSGASPLVVQFNDASYTSDPGGIVLHEWDLDGDGQFNDAFVANPTFTYTSCGTIDVSLRVTDASAVQSTTTIAGAVVVDPITADFSVSELVPGAGIWQFTDLSSPNPTAWAWDFDGDGIVDDTAQSPVYVQPAPAPTLQLPMCTLTVTGAGGCNTDTLVRNLFVTGYGVAEGPIAGGNGTVGTPAVGTYWDLEILNPEGVNITALDVGTYTYAGPADVRVYIKAGTHVGSEGVPTAWTLAAEGTCTFLGGGTTAAPEFANVTLNQSFYLPPGSYGVALYHINPLGGSIQVSYTAGPAASPYGNGDVRIHPAGVGCSSTSELGGCAFSPRLWNGRVYYETCSIANNAAAGTFAGGCVNSAGTVPNLSVTSLPQLGGNYTLDMNTGLAAPAVALVAVGDSKDTFNGQPLPFDLGALLGMTGCELNVSVLAIDAFLANPGPGNPWSFAIPNNPSLICFTFYQQGAVLDPTANPFGWVMSNAMATVVGN